MSDWRISRPRVPPNASRTAVCDWLADPRARSRLAMFAQVISSSNAESVANRRNASA